jgi:predicted anti-sigma-YlaC factor YlaD
MNCKEFKNRIPDYLDQSLGADLSIQFNEHLQNCADCSLLFNKTSRTLHQLNNPDRIPEQPYFYTQLRQKMENKYAHNVTFLQSLTSKKVLQPMLYLASIIFAVYIGILIGSGTTTTSNQYSEATKADTSFIEVFAQYQYIDDMELESLEKNVVNEQRKETEEKK